MQLKVISLIIEEIMLVLKKKRKSLINTGKSTLRGVPNSTHSSLFHSLRHQQVRNVILNGRTRMKKHFKSSKNNMINDISFTLNL